jgi:predicted CXXCH cytochrome family protein
VIALLTIPVCSALNAQDSPTYAHDPIKIGKKKVTVGKGRAARKIDNVTQYCLGCHGDDGQTGEAPKPAHSVGSAKTSHPTDILYPAEKSGYTSTENLDPRLILREGRVSCITCHDVQNSSHELVISPASGELCTACHQK